MVKDQEEIVERIRAKQRLLTKELADGSHVVGYLARYQGDDGEFPSARREWHEAELVRLRNRVSQLATLKEDLEFKQDEMKSLQDALNERDMTMEKLTFKFGKHISDNQIDVKNQEDISSLLNTISKLSEINDFFHTEIQEKDGEIKTFKMQLEDRQREVNKLRGKIRKKKATKDTMDSVPSTGKGEALNQYKKEIMRLRNFTRDQRHKTIAYEENVCDSFRNTVRKLLVHSGAPGTQLQKYDKSKLNSLVAQLRRAYVDFDTKHHMKLSYQAFLDASKSMGINVPQYELRNRFGKYSGSGDDLTETEFVCAVLDRPKEEIGYKPYATQLAELVSGMGTSKKHSTSRLDGRKRASDLPLNDRWKSLGIKKDYGLNSFTRSHV